MMRSKWDPGNSCGIVCNGRSLFTGMKPCRKKDQPRGMGGELRCILETIFEQTWMQVVAGGKVAPLLRRDRLSNIPL